MVIFYPPPKKGVIFNLDSGGSILGLKIKKTAFFIGGRLKWPFFGGFFLLKSLIYWVPPPNFSCFSMDSPLKMGFQFPELHGGGVHV